MSSRLRLSIGLALAVLAPAALASGAPKPNALSKEEKKAGFKLLFDGKTTKGWRGYGKPDVPSAWKVQDGALVFDKKEGDQRGDIITVEQFENFDLLIDWRVTEGGNSGIMYHVQETEKSPWQTGPEMQVLDNVKHRDGQNATTSAGACYALYPPSKDVTRPAGEWNRARLVVNGGQVEHWLNGQKIVEYEKGSEDWNARVAASKFKGFPNFGKPTKGHIDLQDHGDRVEFRNIKIRVLTPPKKMAAKKLP
jgi:hypothetical protein